MRPGRLRESPSQTAGPFVHIGLAPRFAGVEGVADLGSGPLYREGVRGERITIAGRVIDGTGAEVRDALVEAWQADAAGLYPSPSEARGRADSAFIGWGRSPIGADGCFRFETVRPGPVPDRHGRVQAPHVTLWVVARGINLGLHTRLYFPEDEAAHASDPLLGRIDPPARRQTLIAQREASGAYRFDVRLQGEGETVFLDI